MAYRTNAAPPCPRCGAVLTEHAAAKLCSACGGAWLGEPQLDTALRRFQPIVRRWTWWKPARLACPTCGELLQPTLAGNLWLDRCPAHGLWFDAGELRALVAAATGATPPVDGATLIELLRGLAARAPR